jgi:hypothetical protein
MEVAMDKKSVEYVSEFDQFMSAYLARHPEVVADQKVGWRIFWDKQVDTDFLSRAEEGRVPVDSYYYFGSPGPGKAGPAKDEEPTST